jgi:hypothetical protein
MIYLLLMRFYLHDCYYNKSAGLEEQALDGIVMITGLISNNGTLRYVCNQRDFVIMYYYFCFLHCYLVLKVSIFCVGERQFAI